ncbi:exonuclease 1 isoform X2 [Asparagus officinalis]|nr:exonuclease 1 isoform X2 [Asparagus officinalis]
MHRVNLLRHHGIKPVLVFDGGLLPTKIDQETKRSRARKENLERAVEHEAAGNSAAAFVCYQKAVDISPSIALGLIKVLKQEKVDYIVAPYEADAQMTFLCMNKLVDAVITEDSDLIPFGCSRIIFKMDKFGQGVQYQSSMLGRNKELDFTGFTKQMLLEMCILSGCDYLQSLPGMGLKRAYSLVQKFKSYEKVIKHLRYSAFSVPPHYEENFKKAMWAFLHQRVYDPREEAIVHLSDIPPDIGEDLDFLGPWLPPDVVKGIAEGDLDPFTKLPFQVEATRKEVVLDKPHSVKDSVFAAGKKRLDLPVQNNVLTNYFCLASLEAKRKFIAPKVMPKCKETKKSSPQDSINHDSDSPGSAEEGTHMIDHQQSSLHSKDLGDDLSSKDSLIFHQKQFRTPKVMPKCMVTIESSCPSSNSHDSLSPGSTTVATPTINSQLSSPLLSRDLGNDLLMKGLPAEGSNNSTGLLSQESNNESLSPNLTSHKEQGWNITLYETGQVSSRLADDKRPMETLDRKVIKRSPYFLNNSLDKNDTDYQKEEPFRIKQTDKGSGHHTVTVASSIQNDYQKSAAKRRKLLHGHNVPSESQPERNLHITSVEKADSIPNLNNKCKDGKVGGSFGCDVSHIKKYSGIAEKSMEKFASLISSFRYTSSGSRASGLRAPLKDVQNTCPVRSTVGPIDFSKYAYKPKNKSV